MTFLSCHLVSNSSTAQADEENDGVTYFVDEEGRYYYHPGDGQNLMSLQTEASEVSRRAGTFIYVAYIEFGQNIRIRP